MSKAVKTVIGIAAAIAIPFVAPALATSIGTTLGITGMGGTLGSIAGTALTGAALGAVNAKLTGGDVTMGALSGGIGSGIFQGFNPTAGQGGVSALFSGGAPPGTVPGAGAAGAEFTPVSGQANAVVTNVGSGTGYWSPELGQYVDPSTGNTILPQNIAYGGNVSADIGAQLSQGAVSPQGLADAIGQSGTLASNVPVGMGGTPTALNTGGGYFSPDAAAMTSMGPSQPFAAQTSPMAYSSGLEFVPQSTATAGLRAPTAGTAGTAGGTTAGNTGAVRGTGAMQAADMTLRAAGMLAGSAFAGDGLSPEEQQLLAAQTDELRRLQQSNQALFNQRLEQAQNLIGESKYFDPEYFGLQRARRTQVAGARAKRAGLRGLTGERRASEARRYDLATGRDVGSSFDQGYLTGVQGRLQTRQAGLNALPAGYPSSANEYGALRSAYAAGEDRRRQSAEDIGSLFGTVAGGYSSRSRG